MDRLTLLPCPFCGHQSDDLDILEGSTFRWRIGSCKGCGATTGEERIQTSGEGSSAEWEQNCKERINKSWNRRQSLSQEAVRDEAISIAYGEQAHEFFHDGLSADLHEICKDKAEAYAMGYREACLEIGDKLKALKREPNAAAESYESAHPKALDEPAPAAPDVQQPLQPVDPNRVHAGWNIKGEPVYLDEPLATDVASIVKRLKDRGRELFGSTLITAQDDGHLMFDAAALLAKLGEGAPLSADYIQTVPDKCDRIIWRGRYYHLPLKPGASDD